MCGVVMDSFGGQPPGGTAVFGHLAMVTDFAGGGGESREKMWVNVAVVKSGRMLLVAVV